jgi:hypothetical protein
MRFARFDRSRLQLLPLNERTHDMSIDALMPLTAVPDVAPIPNIAEVASRLAAARRAGRPAIWMMGAHVIKQGLSRYVIDLMERGLITHVAMNGACVIHDYELAAVGATTESVRRYIQKGQFGLWNETGAINSIVNEAAGRELGYGEAVGAAILEAGCRHPDSSILAAGVRLGIPVTVHISIGQDIIHEHPNFDGAASGKASYEDFLILAESVSGLEGGIYLNVGTAVMGPEVYLKALAMARNVARQESREIRHFTTAVFDLIELGDDLTLEAAKSDPRYYYRPFKTILVRTVQDGGESYYVRGDHRVTIPALYRAVTPP